MIDLDPLFSDGHSLLNMTFDLKLSNERENTCPIKADTLKPPKREPDKHQLFTDNIDNSEINEIKRIINQFQITDPKLSINEVTHKIEKLFTNSAKLSFKPNKPSLYKNNN